MARIELFDWSEARALAAPIRFEVFVAEQGVPAEIELDALDVASVHAVAFGDTGRPLGTGRLLPVAVEGGRAVSHLGRMAVLRPVRGQGIGGAILQRLLRAARERGDAEVVLSAQTHAMGFYAAHGFVAEGAEYLEAGIPHRDMRLRLGGADQVSRSNS